MIRFVVAAHPTLSIDITYSYVMWYKTIAVLSSHFHAGSIKKRFPLKIPGKIP
jgi:hypothetical protein